MSWCERNGVDYVIGLAKNSRLLKLSASWYEAAATAFDETQLPQRHFGEFVYDVYQAGSWSRPRRVIVKAEHNAQGPNPRFIVTTLSNPRQDLYERGYCARGEMENRIKEYQLGLFADCTSCHLWWPNQFRLLLASLANVLMERLRAIGLVGTELLKVGTVIVRNTRRVRFFLASAFPFQAIFRLVAKRFASG